MGEVNLAVAKMMLSQRAGHDVGICATIDTCLRNPEKHYSAYRLLGYTLDGSREDLIECYLFGDKILDEHRPHQLIGELVRYVLN